MSSETRVGVVRDDRYLLHDSPRHPENKARLSAIDADLHERGVVSKLAHVEPTEASTDEILYAHTLRYLEFVKRLCDEGYRALDHDTYINSHSYETALLAAGGCIRAVDRVMSGQLASAFCLVRPPGHHAEADRARGFCIFNNIAIAAEHAMRSYGLERILIVDWDVHHGNGTQAAFYDDPRVLYFSIHQRFIFPGTGAVGEVGTGQGTGYTVNVPLPGGCGDDDYEMVMKELLVPIAGDHRPQLVLVSAGQDAHVRDPLAGMSLSSSAYGMMTDVIRGIADEHADGRIVMTLEGGYSPQGGPEAAFFILDALGDLGGERPPRRSPGVREETRAIVGEVQEELGDARC